MKCNEEQAVLKLLYLVSEDALTFMIDVCHMIKVELLSVYPNERSAQWTDTKMLKQIESETTHTPLLGDWVDLSRKIGQLKCDEKFINLFVLTRPLALGHEGQCYSKL